MGVFKYFVDKSLAFHGQVGRHHFPGRNHDLPVLPAEGIAVDIHVVEFVVQPDFLKLLEHGVQRAPVPEADVVEDGLIAFHHLPGKAFFNRELPVFRLRQVEAMARKFYIMADVGFFVRDFIGFHSEVLKAAGDQAQPDKPNGGHHCRNGAQGVFRHPVPADSEPVKQALKHFPAGRDKQEQPHQRGEDNNHRQGRKYDRDVGPAGAGNGAQVGIQQVKAVQVFTAGQHQE